MNKKIIKLANFLMIAIVVCLAVFLILPKITAEEVNNQSVIQQKYYLSDVKFSNNNITIDTDKEYELELIIGKTNIANPNLLNVELEIYPEMLIQKPYPINDNSDISSSQENFQTFNFSSFSSKLDISQEMLNSEDSETKSYKYKIILSKNNLEQLYSVFGDSLYSQIFRIQARVKYNGLSEHKIEAGNYIRTKFKSTNNIHNIITYEPKNLKIKINGVLYNENNYAENISLDKPLKIELSYESNRELPSILFFEKTDGKITKDKAIFYPVLEDKECMDYSALVYPPIDLPDVNRNICRYTYSVKLYKNVSLGNKNTYKLDYRVYAVNKNNETFGVKKDIYTKIYFSLSPKIPLVPQKDILEFFGNAYSFGHNTVKMKKGVSSDKVFTDMSTKEISISGINKKIKLAVPKLKNKSSQISNRKIFISQDENGVQGLYIQDDENKEKKLRPIESILDEQNINKDVIVGDINILDTDNTVKYVFNIKRPRKLFGFIPIGYKIETKEINAIESINK